MKKCYIIGDAIVEIKAEELIIRNSNGENLLDNKSTKKHIKDVSTDKPMSVFKEILKRVNLEKISFRDVTYAVYNTEYDDLNTKGYIEDWNSFWRREFGVSIFKVENKNTKSKDFSSAFINILVNVETSLEIERQDYLKRLYFELEKFNKRNSGTRVEDRKIFETYIPPHFKENKELTDRLNIDINDKIHLFAASGAGKSLCMSAVCLSLIGSLGVNIIDEKAVEFYGMLKSRFFKGNNKFFPVLIEAKKYINQDDLLDCAHCSDSEGFKELCTEAEENKELLIIIDAIDEVDFEDNKLERFKKAFHALLNDRNCTVIVTSRYVEYLEREVVLFRKLSLEGFSEEDIKMYINKTVPIEDATGIADLVLNNRSLKTISSNPFVLERVISSAKGHSEKAENVKVYNIIREYVNLTIDRLKKEKDSIDKFLYANKEKIIDYFGYIAWSMVETDNSSILAENFQKTIIKLIEKEISLEENHYDKPYLEKAKELFENNFYNIINYSGIIDVKKEGKLKITFNNDVIKCYLASLYVRKLFQDSEKYNNNTERIVVIDDIEKNIIKHKKINFEIANVIVMFLSGGEENIYQKIYLAFVDYMILRLMDSNEESEIRAIKYAFKLIREESYGNSIFTDRGERAKKIAYIEKLALDFFVENHNER